MLGPGSKGRSNCGKINKCSAFCRAPQESKDSCGAPKVYPKTSEISMGGKGMKEKLKYILEELKHHAPFTLISTFVALALFALTSRFIGAGVGRACPCCAPAHNAVGHLFLTFHLLHILLSCVATTGMFWRHEKSKWKALVVGLSGALILCTVSDIALPFLGGTLVGVGMDFHICIIEHPETVMPFAIVGLFIGLKEVRGRLMTKTAHGLHVFVSVLASMFFLVGYGFLGWMNYPLTTFLIIFFSVLIPCCLGDIVFPLLFKKNQGLLCLTNYLLKTVQINKRVSILNADIN